MSIRLIEPSFRQHETPEAIEVVTMYMMTWQDYYNGFGNFKECDGQFTNIVTTTASIITLPNIGDNYGLYYNTSYLSQLVLIDISMEPTNAIEDGDIDNSGQGLNKQVKVTYTWRNQVAAADKKETEQAASWKIVYNTSLNYKNAENYVDTSDSKRYLWADVYLTEKNPDMIMISTVTGETEDNGPYADGDEATQTRYREQVADTIPDLDFREPNTTVSISMYTSDIIGSNLTASLRYVNSVDFLQRIYTQRELGLIAKNKLPGYNTNDWIDGDDTGKWMFIDWDMKDLGNAYFEYILTFEYENSSTFFLNPDPADWNTYYEYIDGGAGDITISHDQYPTMDFYANFFEGRDLTPSNTGTKQ